jgi:hypothetical protein
MVSFEGGIGCEYFGGNLANCHIRTKFFTATKADEMLSH